MHSPARIITPSHELNAITKKSQPSLNCPSFRPIRSRIEQVRFKWTRAHGLQGVHRELELCKHSRWRRVRGECDWSCRCICEGCMGVVRSVGSKNWGLGCMLRRGKRGRAMKRKITSLVVVEGDLKSVEKKGVGDDAEQLRIANLVCDAVDCEVKSRSAAVVAIGDGHMASATTQLQLMMSKLPEHIRKMPVKKFWKQHCPNTKASTRADGTLCFDVAQDPAFLTRALAFSTVHNTPGFEPSPRKLEGHNDHSNSGSHDRGNLPCNATITNWGCVCLPVRKA